MNAIRTITAVLLGVAVVTTAGVHIAQARTAPPIGWHGCRTGPDDDIGGRLDAVGARCAEVTVPLEHSKPDGRTITVAVARRAATDTARRAGTLVVNTGGPGESLSGVTWLAQGEPPFVLAASPEIVARFDLVAIDPRFHGRSSPLECGWPSAMVESAAWVGPDRRSFTTSVARNRDLAARCAGQADLLPHASTRDVARDLDVVRAALGERRLSYLGWSWGAYLGAVYAQMFPGRIDRMVLDSPVNPDTHGPDGERDHWPAQAAERRNWATWAAKHDDRYHLGRTTAAVLAAVDQIRRAADRGRTLAIGQHRLDPNAVRRIVLGIDTERMYGAWADLMRLFRDAARGIPVTPTAEQDAMFDSVSSTDVAAGASAFAATLCADRAARSRDPETYYRDIQAHRDSEPMYGPTNRNVNPCVFWPTQPAEPPTTVRNRVPALITGATGDATNPYTGQVAMHRVMTGSRMLTLRGAFRHGVYLFDGNACVDGAVNRYLLDGALPDADVTCVRTSPTP